MQLQTRHFGLIAYDRQDTVRFDCGWNGDPHDRNWLLLADAHHPQLYGLQSLQRSEHAVPVCPAHRDALPDGLRIRLTGELRAWRNRRSWMALCPLNRTDYRWQLSVEHVILIDLPSRQAIQWRVDEQALQRAPSAKVVPLRECA